MGVRQFDAICEVTSQQKSTSTDPERWDREDPWFDAARAGN